MVNFKKAIYLLPTTLFGGMTGFGVIGTTYGLMNGNYEEAALGAFVAIGSGIAGYFNYKSHLTYERIDKYLSQWEQELKGY